MKNKILITLSTVFLFGMVSCKQKNDKRASITSTQDYEAYLTQSTMDKTVKLNEEEAFWNAKYEAAPNQFSYQQKMAGIYTQKFEHTADIDMLYKAEQQLREANAAVNLTNAGMLRALAKNYITQHRFQEAHQLLQKANNIGENKKATAKMFFDVKMELGMYADAEVLLDSMRAENFDYYIRLAKWRDYKGNLDGAINSMENAVQIAEDNNDTYRKLWSYSNIADFYGHAGRIGEAYEYYLKTLAIDANYSYALKGIAWIVYSKERNTEGARQIIEAIQAKHNSPDYELFLADLAEYDGNEELKKLHLANYWKMLQAKNYGEMYNAYNIELLADDSATTAEAVILAECELENRKTPQTYDLLAWALFKNGESEKAFQIVEDHVVGKTYEPVALYHTAQIFKANGMKKEAELIKEELLSAIYELGPTMETKINTI